MLNYIKELNEKGIVLEMNGDKLKVHLLTKDVDESLLEEIRNKKEQLLDFLSQNVNEYKVIPQTELQDSYPLSAIQHRLWLHSQYQEASLSYNMPFHIEINDVKSASFIIEAINSLIMRHETLRTVFRLNEEGEIRQYILKWQDLGFCVKELDFQAFDSKDINEFIKNESFKLFELDKGPLVRVYLLKISPSSYILFFNIHHIIFDGTSMDVVRKDFYEYYQSNMENRKPTLAPLEIQYKDFSVWYNEKLNKEHQNSKTYWLNELKDIPEPVNLSFAKKRPKIRTYNGEQLEIKINRELAEKLKNISIKHNNSLFVTFIAIWKILLYKYTANESILVGIPVSGREHAGLNDQIGFYVNTIVVKSNIKPEDSFSYFISETNKKLLLSIENQNYPIDLLVNDLNINWDMSRNPLFDIMLKYQNDKWEDFDIKEDTIKDIGEVPSRFDMNVCFTEHGENLHLDIIFNKDIFIKKDIERMITHFMRLCHNIMQNPNGRIRDFEYLCENEKYNLLNNFNNTKKEISENTNVIDLLLDKVDNFPDQIALIDDSNDITYNELNYESNKIANLLLEKGIKKGEYVCLYMGRRIAFVSSMYGALKSGAAYVPIDSDIPKERLKFIINDLKIKKIITDNEHINKVYEICKESNLHSLDIICVDKAENKFSYDLTVWDKNDIEERPKELNTIIPVYPDDEVYVIYTSGSTGEPKGVVVQHRPLINVIEWVNGTFSVSRHDKILMVSSVSFDLSVYDIFGGIAAGAAVRIASHAELKLLHKLNDIIIKESITIWNSAPAFMALVVDNYTGKADTSLRLTLLSGDWIPLSLPQLLKKYSDNNTVVSLGGATEATIWSNYFIVDEIQDHWVSVPYGKPIQNARYYILNHELQPCPVGMEGDLYIGGDVLAKEYKNNEVLTREKFLTNPYNSSERIYKTGDRAKYFEDGNIEFLGRLDDQFKIRGYRVELGEIKKTITLFPGITDCVLLVLDTNNDKKIIAFYVTDDNVDINHLKFFLSERIPTYMIPGAFIAISKIPITSNGKVNKVKLTEIYKENISDREFEFQIIKPSSEHEEALANIWSRMLNINVENISMNSNFFELGGNSIHLIKFLSEINLKYKYEIKISDFLLNPTINAISILVPEMKKNKLKI